MVGAPGIKVIPVCVKVGLAVKTCLGNHGVDRSDKWKAADDEEA